MKALFPPFPMPGFIPDFSAYNLDTYVTDWYDMYEFISPDDSLEYVRNTLLLLQLLNADNDRKHKICNIY